MKPPYHMVHMKYDKTDWRHYEEKVPTTGHKKPMPILMSSLLHWYKLGCLSKNFQVKFEFNSKLRNKKFIICCNDFALINYFKFYCNNISAWDVIIRTLLNYFEASKFIMARIVVARFTSCEPVNVNLETPGKRQSVRVQSPGTISRWSNALYCHFTLSDDSYRR